MPEELFEHTTGQGKQENDSDEEIEALKFTEKMMDDKIDKDAILQAIALYHVYSSTAEDGNVVALRGLNVSVKKGEAVAIVGPSGSGKSTLLKCLGVLMKPSAGGVILNGKSTTRRTGLELVKMRQETVSFIFQEGNLLPDLSAIDNVAQALRHKDVRPSEAKRKAMDILIELGLEERVNSMPATLSGGEQQRVAIARALVTNPKLILADEPTGALDPITSREVLELFGKLHAEKGVAFLIVTHSDEVAAFCDRSLELRDGRFVAEHGTNLDVDDLEGTRELIVDELGTVSFPPEVLMKMGGSGRYEIAHNEKGEVTLVTAEKNKSMIKGKKVLASQCPACNHKYKDDSQLCPECGSSRPMVSES